ncbi:hypothetical protein [Streptomyces jeddahensis]|uniref:Uncharacterized protein n=1 Tax=Streptomyces jeddahensis TaxID=1716141 RepID=A0A177HUE5_9ACTN|nr:hypothetical protein [Streptomyces jeddahensis]OAH14592.1 hypothetical protein STSP_21030 [Streptomyces jeddahensis]
MRAHRAKRAFVCVAAGFVLAGGTAIGTSGTAAAAAPATTTASAPTGEQCKWHKGYYDKHHKWHKGYWDCKSKHDDKHDKDRKDKHDKDRKDKHDKDRKDKHDKDRRNDN